MAIESIYCPACNNKLRVPDELMGQQVQCPKCQAMFTAPPPPPAPTAMSTDRPGAPPQRMPADHEDLGYDDDRWDYERRRPTGPNPVPPGVCMIVVSILGLLVNTFDIVLMGFFPQEFKKMLANNPLIAAGGGAPGGADFTTIKLAGSAICLFISFVILAGGISMIPGRMKQPHRSESRGGPIPKGPLNFQRGEPAVGDHLVDSVSAPAFQTPSARDELPAVRHERQSGRGESGGDQGHGHE